MQLHEAGTEAGAVTVDRDFTAEEVTRLAVAFPEHVWTPPGGRPVATISRKELLALETAYPTMFQAPRPRASVTTEEEDILRAKYPTMF